MSRCAIVLSVFMGFALVVGTAAQAPSPYAGQEQRPIKALSETEMRDLAEGRGMGLAKAAELNSYPGPCMCSNWRTNSDCRRHNARRARS
jgi:hypothetical protein